MGQGQSIRHNDVPTLDELGGMEIDAFYKYTHDSLSAVDFADLRAVPYSSSLSQVYSVLQ